MDNFFIALDYLDLLAVKGEDSGKFLQGQLTCDVDGATPAQAIPGAVCNNKGRVLGSFLLVGDDEGYYLEMKPGMLASNKANFDKYIPFYKTVTADAGSEFRRLGVAGPRAAEVLAGCFPALPDTMGGVVIHKGHRLILRNHALGGILPRYELWLRAEDAAGIGDCVRAALPEGSPALWELQDLRQGIYHIETPRIGEYTPQQLNYDLKGFVSFRKGCYTGQEIVARMHYRGNPKKRLYPVRVSTNAPLEQVFENPQVSDAGGKRSGELVHLLPGKAGDYEGVAQLDLDKVENKVSFTTAGGAGLEVGQA